MTKSRVQQCLLNHLTSFSKLMCSTSCVVSTVASLHRSCCHLVICRDLSNSWSMHIYIVLLALENVLSFLLCVNTLSLDMPIIPQNWRSISPFYPQSNHRMVEILGAKPTILDSRFCKFTVTFQSSVNKYSRWMQQCLLFLKIKAASNQ